MGVWNGIECLRVKWHWSVRRKAAQEAAQRQPEGRHLAAAWGCTRAVAGSQHQLSCLLLGPRLLLKFCFARCVLAHLCWMPATPFPPSLSHTQRAGIQQQAHGQPRLPRLALYGAGKPRLQTRACRAARSCRHGVAAAPPSARALPPRPPTLSLGTSSVTPAASGVASELASPSGTLPICRSPPPA